MSTQDVGIEKILECPVCMDTYKKPKVLPCQHSFCLECLFKSYRDGHRFNPFKVTCPVCREDHEIRTFTMTLNDFDQQFPNHYILLALLDAKQKAAEMKKKAVEEKKNVKEGFIKKASRPTPSKPIPTNKYATMGHIPLSESPYSSSPRCINCVIEPKWHCVMCDKQLCNDCVSEHFETFSSHEIFNLESQLMCQETIQRNAVTGHVRPFLYRGDGEESTWDMMWKEYMTMMLRSASCITKGAIIGAYSSQVLARSEPPSGRDFGANEEELQQICEIFRDIKQGFAAVSCSFEGVRYNIVSGRDNIVLGHKADGGGFFAIKTRHLIIIALFSGKMQETITAGAAVERIAKILRESDY